MNSSASCMIHEPYTVHTYIKNVFQENCMAFFYSFLRASSYCNQQGEGDSCFQKDSAKAGNKIFNQGNMLLSDSPGHWGITIFSKSAQDKPLFSKFFVSSAIFLSATHHDNIKSNLL